MNAPVQFDDHTKLDWWSAALKGERRPITANEPMTGYYRARSKNKQTGVETLYAVAYWWHQGKCFCKVNGGETLTGEKHERMMTAWPFVSQEPVKFDVYQAVLAGKPWPDQHVTEKVAPAEASTQPLDAQGTPPVAGAADTKPADPVDDSPQGKLKREIEAAKKGLANYVKAEGDKFVSTIDSDAKAGACQSLRAQLLGFANSAKKAREAANKPHHEAITAIGKIWTPLEFAAKSAADDLRDGPLTAWERHKREQQALAAKSTASQASAGAAPTISNAPAPSAKIKGATGKAASVTEIAIAVIHDFDQVYAHFRDNEQVKAILQGLANAAVRAGIEVPGTTKEKDVSIK